MDIHDMGMSPPACEQAHTLQLSSSHQPSSSCDTLNLTPQSVGSPIVVMKSPIAPNTCCVATTSVTPHVAIGGEQIVGNIGQLSRNVTIGSVPQFQPITQTLLTATAVEGNIVQLLPAGLPPGMASTSSNLNAGSLRRIEPLQATIKRPATSGSGQMRNVVAKVMITGNQHGQQGQPIMFATSQSRETFTSDQPISNNLGQGSVIARPANAITLTQAQQMGLISSNELQRIISSVSKNQNVIVNTLVPASPVISPTISVMPASRVTNYPTKILPGPVSGKILLNPANVTMITASDATSATTTVNTLRPQKVIIRHGSLNPESIITSSVGRGKVIRIPAHQNVMMASGNLAQIPNGRQYIHLVSAAGSNSTMVTSGNPQNTAAVRVSSIVNEVRPVALSTLRTRLQTVATVPETPTVQMVVPNQSVPTPVPQLKLKWTSRRGRTRIHPPRERSTYGRVVPIRSRAEEMNYTTREFLEKEDESLQQTNSPLIPFNKVKERTAAALKVVPNTSKGQPNQRVPTPVLQLKPETTSRRGRPRIHPPRETSTYGRGVPIRSQAREMIYATREFFEKEDESLRQTNSPLIPFNKVKERTAAALKVSKSTVQKVRKEKFGSTDASTSKQPTPGEKRPRNPTTTTTKLDSLQEYGIRCHIYEYYLRREQPTIKKLLVSLQQSNLFHGSYFSLLSILHDLGFEYKKINGRKLLLERGDIVTWRCRFLQDLKTKNLLEVVWLDETWVNAGHTVPVEQTENTCQETTPAGKGGRFIMLHAGTANGFVKEALLLFKSRKTGDFHEELDHNKFYKWFEGKLLPNIQKSSVIVMDNAPYHTVEVDKVPTNACRKDEMIDWLLRHGVQADHDMAKGTLLSLIFENNPRTLLYQVDELAKKHGHQVFQLPPNHNYFNPIEQIWVQVKDYVAKNNKTFTLTEVKNLITDGLNEVSSEDWKKSVLHTQKQIQEAIEREEVMDSAVDELILNLPSSSTSSSSCDSGSSSEEEMEVRDPLSNEDVDYSNM